MATPTELLAIALPGGRWTHVRCGSDDLSITRPLHATRGQWEPHLRAFFERTVRPDWVCLDIGANIGIHTLGLAVLATKGRVVAFEADPRNHAWLVDNIALCSEPHGAIDVVESALWDRPGTISVASFDELTGCSFISTTGSLDDGERRIRDVLASGFVEQQVLTTRMTEVKAQRLDDWAALDQLSRLDFIKIDIEGAEIQALGGAIKTIERFRPLLLSEYNPACGAAYYGHAPEAYFVLLQRFYPTIQILHADGTLSGPIARWDDLETALQRLVFVDLVCST